MTRHKIGDLARLDSLDGYLIQNDYDLRSVLAFLAGIVPAKQRAQVTSAVIVAADAEYKQVWITEYSKWYEIGAIYELVYQVEGYYQDDN